MVHNLTMYNKFPFRVTLLLWLVSLLTAWNFLRAWTAFAWQDTLNEFSSKPTAWIIGVSGGIWVILGVVIIWAIWQGKAWTAKLLLGTAAGYTVLFWGEKFIWQMPRPNWPFAVILNLVLIIFIIFTQKSLTREAYEQKSQHPEIE
jgi:hypothetical protein